MRFANRELIVASAIASLSDFTDRQDSDRTPAQLTTVHWQLTTDNCQLPTATSTLPHIEIISFNLRSKNSPSVRPLAGSRTNSRWTCPKNGAEILRAPVPFATRCTVEGR